MSPHSKTEHRRGTDFAALAVREMKRDQKMKEGEGEGKKGSFLPFLPTPSPLFCLRHFISRSPFFAPKPHGNACYAS